MAEEEMRTKADLLANTERNWQKLNALLDSLTEGQMTTLKDAAGWTVKDHIIHMVYWERSVVYFVQGKPTWEGLGVSEAQYRGDYNATNALVQQQHQDVSLAGARAELRSTHQQMLTLLEPLTDADMQRPFRPWREGESGEGQGPKTIELLAGNMGGHFAEHIPWIEALVSKQ